MEHGCVHLPLTLSVMLSVTGLGWRCLSAAVGDFGRNGASVAANEDRGLNRVLMLTMA